MQSKVIHKPRRLQGKKKSYDFDFFLVGGAVFSPATVYAGCISEAWLKVRIPREPIDGVTIKTDTTWIV